ncbi:GNAT family N-acetyltransferase [Parapedobacter koreensis]|uniref:ElaA protein n=1 Tax=Parapedobacter koreensis TaxID=332977 RepID=A0A1H7Q572_9SPHI|nr:GNAT family N-acetyltransferase [Parapedobacter koreensis]SEL43143.1 ElaA protein [Parapedobacter koreensis]
MDKQIHAWDIKPFDALSLEELYKILQLRQEVFILEQACVYSDLDNKDQKSFHLMGWHGDVLAAYTRLIPWGISYPDATSIGRVLVAKDFRGIRLGEELMLRSIEAIYARYGRHTIKIGAQQHLKAFYNHLGFEQTSEPYMDAGILHIEMTRACE